MLLKYVFSYKFVAEHYRKGMIKRRKCSECTGYAFSKGLCKYCWNKKFGKPIKKISQSYQITLDLYRPKRKAFLLANPYCNLSLEGCTKTATCIHHKKGKASRELYLDENFWMPSCISCNNEVERIGNKAYELGLKIKHNSK